MLGGRCCLMGAATDVRRRPRAETRADPDRSNLIGHTGLTPYLLSGPSILAITVLLVFPVIYAIWGSLHDTDSIGGPQYFVGLQQYIDLFQDPDFLWSISRTVIFVVGVLVLGLALGLVFGFALNGAAGKLRFLRGLTIVPYLVSGVATAVIFRLILNRDFGQVNRVLEFFGVPELSWFSDPNLAMLASILAQVWSDLPLVALLILGGLQTVDPELMDAGKVDGASGWDRAWRISMPLITPQLALSTVLLSYQALTSLGVIIALTGGGPVDATRTLPIALYESAFVDLRTNEALAIVVVILLFNAVLTLGYVGLSRRYDMDDR
ncbi:MAG: ABC transporter permease subunit [Acidimicrobiia bacterium]|nr:ABC transporter permease subunit [Acidimicrobiia bacterium]